MPRSRTQFHLSRWDANAAIGAIDIGQAALLSIATFDEDIYMIDGDFCVVFDNYDADDPPLLYGLTPMGDLSTADIQACINADGPSNRGDSDTMELMTRKLYYMGVIEPHLSNGTDKEYIKFHKRFKLNFPVYNEGTATIGVGSLNFWVYNLGFNNLATGRNMKVVCQLHGKWM